MGMLHLLQLLTEDKVDFVLVGGLAVSLHGYQRVTMDVDVTMAMDDQNIQRFIRCARKANLQPIMPIPLDSLANPDLLSQWHREKGMLAFGLRGPETMSTILDILIRPSVTYAQLKREAQRIDVGSMQIPIASIDHLIAMKTGTGRSKDRIDIQELEKIRSRGVS